MMLQLWLTLSLLTPFPIQVPGANTDPVAEYRTAAVARWEQDIQALE
jgi:hypothetical protein